MVLKASSQRFYALCHSVQPFMEFYFQLVWFHPFQWKRRIKIKPGQPVGAYFYFFLLYLSLYFLTQLLIATNRIPKRKKNYWNIYVQAARIICTSDVQFYVSIPCFMWCWIVQDLPLLLQLVSCFISQSLCMFLPCMTFYFNLIRSLKNVFTVKLKDQQFVSLVSRFGAVVEDLQWIKGM